MNPDSSSAPSSRALKWALIIAIIIVLNLLFNYAISLFYPAPQYENFCPQSQVVTPPTNQQDCIAAGGQWNQSVSPQTPTQTTPEISGYCNTSYTCNQNFTTAQEKYSRTVFIVLLILGVLSLVGGVIFSESGVVAAGLSLGGVLSLIIAAVRYWGEAANVLKVLILVVALAALLWLGLKKFKN